MPKRVVNPDGRAEPRGFNHGLLVDGGELLFIAGQDASGPDGEIVAPGDLVGQFEQVMSNLAAVVEDAGGDSSDMVKLNVYVEEYPAMALFEVSGFFQPETLVELDGFAVIDPD
jgi:enamine deaminase RidA (YjgF/YER057c/UK114 family)